MADYIDREAALKIIAERQNNCTNIRPDLMTGLARAWLDVDAIPAADVSPVVRCKDCVHMIKKGNFLWCMVWQNYNGAGEDGFCNYGERKDND